MDPTRPGPWTVSYTLTSVDLGERVLPVGVWAPSDAPSSEVGLDALVAPEVAAELRALLEQAPEACPTRALRVALDAPIAEGTWPLVVYSHCHECLGVSGASTAARLASWGFIVLTPDHVGNTLWNALAGDGVALGPAFLQVRGEDLMGVVDAALDVSGALASVAARVDESAIAVVGHSFGAVSAGWVAERDPRVSAAVALAAPIDNPLVAGVSAASIEVPMLFVVAVEDNSITELGNGMLRDNFRAVSGSAIKIEIEDAGHWSVSDLCGLVDDFRAGCGTGLRQTRRAEFTYLEPALGREVTASWVAGFLGAALRTDPYARAWLDAQSSSDALSIERRSER